MPRVVERLNAPVHEHVVLNEEGQAGRGDGEIDVIGFFNRQANPVSLWGPPSDFVRGGRKRGLFDLKCRPNLGDWGIETLLLDLGCLLPCVLQVGEDRL